MMENPQAMDGERTFGMRDAELWGGPWEQEQMANDFSSMHAVNATTAAYHADVAAKHAASLAQWVQYLSGTLHHLQNKVADLEDWKKRALEETRKLRDEHKIMRQLVLQRMQEEDRLNEQAAAVRLETGEGSHDAEAPGPPPGLGLAASSDGLDLRCTAKKAGDSADGTPQAATTSSASSLSISSASSFGDIDLGVKEEGVHVADALIGGLECKRAEWRIGHLSTKLRGCMGRALVSSPFSVVGLEDVRLMICPDGREAAQGPRSRRQKELYAKRITEGPLDGCLKIKIPSCPSACELEYFLVVGSVRRGPFRRDFAESTVGECDDFGDWLKQLALDRSLTVAVEILRAPAGDGAAAPAPSEADDTVQ
mmetsp:Transcript_95528/g.308332  ORF Transcript_95528/g.308332 Transcript_95528/m.308332 type:complete len:368 (-) Transcript_95528:229-1332(-)